MAGMGDGLGNVLSVVIGIVGIGIPVALQVIADQNLTGITATIVGFIPVALAYGAIRFFL